MELTGEVFLPEEQKNSWNTTIAQDIPVRWGMFDSPFKQSRAVGIAGSYKAQYWTMLRVKLGKEITGIDVSERIRNQLNLAVKAIESKTNVRFYNSQRDNKYFEVGSFKLELPNIVINMYDNDSKIEGSGSYGLIGGEQYIYCSTDLNNKNKYSDEEVRAFLMHALCNAAGMFNEQQRNDRDNYVTIYTANIKSNCKPCFEKQTKNYVTMGNFDYNSITMASSKSYSVNGENTIVKKGDGGEIKRNLTLSESDINFLNAYYLPYIARKDNYVQLDKKVYRDGRLLTDTERQELQDALNAERGLTGTPPESGVIIRDPW